MAAYQHGQLSTNLVSACRRHLNDCSSCRGEFASIQRASALLREMVVLDPPSDLTAKVMRRIRQESSVSRHQWQGLPRVIGMRIPVFATVIIMFFLVFLITPRNYYWDIREPAQIEMRASLSSTEDDLVAILDLVDGGMIPETENAIEILDNLSTERWSVVSSQGPERIYHTFDLSEMNGSQPRVISEIDLTTL